MTCNLDLVKNHDSSKARGDETQNYSFPVISPVAFGVIGGFFMHIGDSSVPSIKGKSVDR